MVVVILLAALCLWALIATAVELRRDGHRAVPTDWTRVAEHDLAERTAKAPPPR